jgi:signal recognition particle GTPase
VNTSISGTAFNDPLAKDIEADHIALTHIDQSLKWGKTVQLLANTDYKLRYISSGPSILSDLLPFKPEKFARKLLRA